MNLFKSKINGSEEALKALQSDFEALNQTFENLNTEYATLQEQFKTLSEQATTYKEEFERVSKENEELKLEVVEATEEVVEVTQEAIANDDLASMKAVEILAGVGHPQIEILETEDQEEEQDLVTRFKALKGKEALDFYEAHKKDIKAILKR
jgi:uncharacterized coiled-coil DUF342 family protein